MSTATEIEGTQEAWESRALGANESYVQVAEGVEEQIDTALELHPISIRLQRGLLENLKALAQLNGIGYQPLVRQILTRFVDCEMKNLLAAKLAEQKTTRPSRAPATGHKKAA